MKIIDPAPSNQQPAPLFVSSIIEAENSHQIVSYNEVTYRLVTYNLVSLYRISIFEKNIMETPFVFGKIASDKNFTDRKDETERLVSNFTSSVNTILISPQKMG